MLKELLPSDSPRVVYDIRQDSDKLERMRKASLSDGPWGLAMDNGIIGSGEWWAAVSTGKLELETFVGIINLKEGGMKRDTLEVSIESNKEKKRWVAWNGFSSTLKGKRVCVRYVQMKPKKSLPSRPNFLVHVLLQVEILD